VDSVEENTWRNINRPHADLDLQAILTGMLEFAGQYTGVLTSETMLVEGVNLNDAVALETAEFLRNLKPQTAYLSIPTRPPSERAVRAPDEEELNRVYQIFSSRLAKVEYLTGYEGNAFASTGDLAQDLLSITAVHPMRDEAVMALLAKTGSDWDIIQEMIVAGQLREIEYAGRKFYVRRFHQGTSQ
jgi:wyosine [tRNA(Phe)-imidazoG37] synthetase (radical SAM superfamily)